MGLKHGDLKNCINSDVSIDEFEPKAGNSEEIIVVGLFGNDDYATKDLEDFITKGTVGIIDVDVSPNPNEEGNFMVFVEMPRDENFPKQFRAMLADVENLTGKMTWRVSPYLTDEYFLIDDPRWEKFVMMQPDAVVSKEDFVAPDLDDLEEAVQAIFAPTMATVLSVDEEQIVLEMAHRKMVAKIIDYGRIDDVIERHEAMLHALKFDLHESVAIRAFTKVMGNHYRITNFDTCQQAINFENDVMVLFKDVEYL